MTGPQPSAGPGCHRRLTSMLAVAALTVAALLALAWPAAAQDQDCGDAVVCAQADPRVGPVVDQIGPNEFDLGGLFG